MFLVPVHSVCSDTVPTVVQFIDHGSSSLRGLGTVYPANFIALSFVHS